HDPHRHILSPVDIPHATSWPRALGFGAHADEGLAIGLGWEARGTLRAAYGRAEQTGDMLAAIVSDLSQQSGRPVGLIGHSLGGRVALRAMHKADAGSLGRVILLNAAEFRDTAAKAVLQPAGRQAEVINVTARENDLFDFALEHLLARGQRRALGFGLQSSRANWVDLQIDDMATLDGLAELGFPTERGARRLSHWTPYLRGGLFAFYRAALCHPWALPLALLRHHLPEKPQPRWSRLLAGPAALGAMRA
ncbi:MAG: DUF726 domain-containing protein, partial [Paracoccus sp. (in: a-proteobacteria)]|nr:DUF726 domain-containing protein [Paracoccus sp. (in: a-proteobacteria)]